MTLFLYLNQHSNPKRHSNSQITRLNYSLFMEFLNNEDAQTYRCYVVGFEFNWQRLKESRIISLKSVYSGYISTEPYNAGKNAGKNVAEENKALATSVGEHC